MDSEWLMLKNILKKKKVESKKKKDLGNNLAKPV